MKMRKIVLLFVALLMVSMHTNARPRTVEEMKLAAAAVLTPHYMPGTRNAMPLIQLDKGNGWSVFGYQNAGFAVLADDDMYPDVLGYSETHYNPNTQNANFKWWLNAIGKVVSTHRDTPLQLIKPDSDKYPTSVAPFVTTHWGQTGAYSMYVPAGCPSGCVATAASQVLKYNEWPEWGVGEPYTFYPFGDFDGECLKADISRTRYNYAAMLDTYGYSSGDTRQRRAVGILMYHVGLSMKAQYDGVGTGSYSEVLCHGLRNNLSYPLAVTVHRENYTEEEWMDMVFGLIANHIPIIYGGADESFEGHEFVLHGYNTQGRVYINWGWDGEEDGYFDLSSLYIWMGFYNFNVYQDMVLRCAPNSIACDTVAVTLTQPGTLEENLTQEQRDSVVALVVEGPLNGSDLRLLREMAGSDAYGHGTMGHLSWLDLSKAHIVAGGEPYRIVGDNEWRTADDEMPDFAFDNCAFLIKVTLPNDLKHYGKGVFANCFNLDSVKVTAGEESDFIVTEHFVLNAEGTELIECLPSEDVHYQVPGGVTTICDYAFAGKYLYERLSLPPSVNTIGAYAFNRCFDLKRTYLYSEEPPAIDDTAIDKLDLSLRYLYVPKGSISKYKNAQGWKDYGSRIMEFDAETGIETVQQHETPVTQGVYTLDGMQVSQQQQHLPQGIYVKNGRKFVKK